LNCFFHFYLELDPLSELDCFNDLTVFVEGVDDLHHKHTAWGCRGCGRIPNAEKMAIIWAKFSKVWAKYTVIFTCK